MAVGSGKKKKQTKKTAAKTKETASSPHPKEWQEQIRELQDFSGDYDAAEHHRNLWECDSQSRVWTFWADGVCFAVLFYCAGSLPVPSKNAAHQWKDDIFLLLDFCHAVYSEFLSLLG